MADHHPIQNSLAGLICVAATLLSVPGTLIYIVAIVGLHVANVDLGKNLMAPLLLASAGMMLGLLGFLGLAAGVLHSFRRPASGARLLRLCVLLNAIALSGLAILVLTTPQFK